VEHPVTELVTGLDLVEWQLRVASGEPLSLRQEDVRMSGHALECRVTAEDPSSDFLPSTGTIASLAVPSGPGIRWDGGVTEGSDVGVHYDSLLGKLIAHGASRAIAIRRMARALDELVVVGVDTSAPFHRRAMRDPDFQAGRLDIRYVADHPDLLKAGHDAASLRAVALAAALLQHGAHQARSGGGGPSDPSRVRLSQWQTAGWPWRSGR
jgi:acetyl-CoA carboxylase biotin carboxylase subunit